MLLSLRPSRAVAMFALVRAVERWDPAKHPRIPKGLPDGGQFLTLDERMQVALHSGGDLKGFSRPSLLKAAKDRGIYVRRGASEDELRSALEKDIKAKGVSDKAKTLADALKKGDVPEAPKAKTAKGAARNNEPSPEIASLLEQNKARSETKAMAARDRELRFGKTQGPGKPKPPPPNAADIAAGHKAKKAAKPLPVTPEGKPDLEKMTVPQLRAFAKANDVPRASQAKTRADLLYAIGIDDVRGGMHRGPGASEPDNSATIAALVSKIPDDSTGMRKDAERILAGKALERGKPITTPSGKARMLRGAARAHRENAWMTDRGNPTPENAKKLTQANQRAEQMEAIADLLAARPGRASMASQRGKPDAAKVSADFAEAVKRPMPSDRERFKAELGGLTGAQLADVALAHGVKLPAGTKQKKADFLVEHLFGYKLNSEAIRHGAWDSAGTKAFGLPDPTLERNRELQAAMNAADARGDRDEYDRLRKALTALIAGKPGPKA